MTKGEDLIGNDGDEVQVEHDGEEVPVGNEEGGEHGWKHWRVGPGFEKRRGGRASARILRGANSRCLRR